jgi:NhaP-type Na+/H+ or K+/H+ antiporter
MRGDKMQPVPLELLSIFVAGITVGFVVGFAVRASISRHRRARAERNRMIVH